MKIKATHVSSDKIDEKYPEIKSLHEGYIILKEVMDDFHKETFGDVMLSIYSLISMIENNDEMKNPEIISIWPDSEGFPIVVKYDGGYVTVVDDLDNEETVNDLLNQTIYSLIKNDKAKDAWNIVGCINHDSDNCELYICDVVHQSDENGKPRFGALRARKF